MNRNKNTENTVMKNTENTEMKNTENKYRLRVAENGNKVLVIKFDRSRKEKPQGTKVHLLYAGRTHEGQKNNDNKAYPYDVYINQPFGNQAAKEPYAGLKGQMVDSGQWRSFRMDRIVSMTAIN